METAKVTSGETLDDIINESGLKLDHIAKELGITPNYLWRIRRSPNRMNFETIENLANVLNVDPDRLNKAIRLSSKSDSILVEK